MTKYSPEQVAGITGIAPADIISLARNFSRASRPLAICGKGSGKTPGSLNEFMAVHALNALVGNINAKGGVWAVPGPAYTEWPEAERDETAAAGLQTDRLDGAESGFPAASRMHRFFDAVSTGKGYPVEALFIAGSNPCYSQEGAETVRTALGKIPFVVSFSSYMDETALNADLILPNHTYLERIEDVPAPSGFPRPIISLATPVVEPQFNTRHLGDVVMDLARTLGGTMSDAFAWETFETCLEESLADRWDALLENGFWTDAAFAPAAGADFGTASGKFEFFPAGLENGFAPVAIDGEEGAYPLVLIPYDSMRLASGYAGNTPFMTKTVDETVLEKKSVFVEINSKTAGALNLSEGRFAVLTTPKGKARVRIHIFDGVMPGVVALPRGLGHSGPDKYLAGKGVNFNDLIGPVEDPVSGLDAAWGIRAKLAKA
jgi:menaquinone reductase, molybdopterin-binding-like subunit